MVDKEEEQLVPQLVVMNLNLQLVVVDQEVVQPQLEVLLLLVVELEKDPAQELHQETLQSHKEQEVVEVEVLYQAHKHLLHKMV